MKKLILSVAVIFAMSTFGAFAQDTKKEKKEGAKTEQSCCKKDAKATDKDKKTCCDAKGDKKECCQQKEAKKKGTPKSTAGDKK
jgi:hypothetical protein